MTKKQYCYSIDLSSENGILQYKQVISTLNLNNPYYSYELINDSANFGKLTCFVLNIGDLPVIAMPFTLIPITINNKLSSFFDACSPYGFSGPLYTPDTSDELLTIFWEKLNIWYYENNVITEFIRFGLNHNYRCYNGKLVPSLLNIKG